MSFRLLLSLASYLGPFTASSERSRRWSHCMSLDAMSRLSIRVVALFLFTVLPGCNRTLHLQIPSGTPVKLVTFHEDPGTTIVELQEVLLQPDIIEYRLLQQWLRQNQHGWSQSLATNPGGGIVVRAGDLSLQFVGGAVFTWTDKGQFQKKIREDDYVFLKKAAGK